MILCIPFKFYCVFVASCDEPGLMAGGIKIGNDFSHGQKVTYKCTDQGYSLIGNPQLTCNDGRWDSDKPECRGKYSLAFVHVILY